MTEKKYEYEKKYIPVPIYSEMKNANMEVKFAYVVCNLKPFA